MLHRIVIARHGNTFAPGQTPTRVGAKTDLPLVESHRARSIGLYLKEQNITPDMVYAAPLKRTTQTAQLAIKAMELHREVILSDEFTEIDYGPDENRTEDEVMLRLGGGELEQGRSVIELWNERAVVPQGWCVDPQQIIRSWSHFANEVSSDGHQTVLLVTSNGIIRFAPHLTGDFELFAREHDIKVVTGGVCIFERESGERFWRCTAWNIKPYKLYKE